jgi:hypothetical protein
MKIYLHLLYKGIKVYTENLNKPGELGSGLKSLLF